MRASVNPAVAGVSRAILVYRRWLHTLSSQCAGNGECSLEGPGTSSTDLCGCIRWILVMRQCFPKQLEEAVVEALIDEDTGKCHTRDMACHLRECIMSCAVI
jgi:hypothetical protein